MEGQGWSNREGGRGDQSKDLDAVGWVSQVEVFIGQQEVTVRQHDCYSIDTQSRLRRTT